MANKNKQNNKSVKSADKKVLSEADSEVKSTGGDDKKVLVEGVVLDNQDSDYLIEIELGGLTHQLKAYPSGRMRTYYRGRINKGDRVTVEVDPEYNIDIGRIVRKHVPKRYRNRS